MLFVATEKGKTMSEKAITWTAEKVELMLDDLHALMWYGDGCEICAHAIEEQRKPYRRLRCSLGSAADCKPMWRGLKGADDE